ncbi:hypothetical protein JCM17823_05080 [Halorubrum gandharaense]
MAPDPFRKIVDERTNYSDVSDQFYDERLDRDDLSTADWPSQIDRAAVDLLYGVALGQTDSKSDHGGTIGRMDFGRATGEYYVEGLTDLAGENSALPSLIRDHSRTAIGNLAFALSKLRYELANEKSTDIQDIDRAIEAIVEKLVTQGITPSSGRQPLHDPEAVVDVVHQLFSDPAASEYADGLIDSLDKIRTKGGDVDLLKFLDRPQMVTPLWDHQQEALANWCDADYNGYVNMATATGKTVLGLGAIAHLFGELHPRDEEQLPSRGDSPSDAKVLVVAGQELLLEQWQSEFDEHLNIPRDRTVTGGDRTISLSWGSIEFRTAQDLLSTDVISGYDLVILDEAHRYRNRGSGGRSWQNLFDTLSERSEAILAMSGSIDQEWIGDDSAREALEEYLTECATFTIPDAREANVIADFSWEVLYAASAIDDTLSGVSESTEPLSEVYDRSNHKFPTADLDSVPDYVPETFETLRDLRSYAQSNDGSKARDRSAPFDRLATAAFSRRPRRWQLRPPRLTIRNLVLRHVDDSKCIVLVQSYEQAEYLGDMLRSDLGDEVVEVANSETASQAEQIDRFRSRDNGVIIGPGDVIGVGVDIPDADVAINLAKGGVNASLIQRIGRVLRNPTGDGRAHFYQIVTLPATAKGRLAGEDGRRLLRRAAEFRALGSRFRELPGFSTADGDTASILAELEVAGSLATSADHRTVEEITEDDVAQEWLYELLDAIDERNQATDPVLPIVWVGETVDPTVEPIKAAIRSRKRDRKPQSSPGTGQSSTDTESKPKERVAITVADENDDAVPDATVEFSASDVTDTETTSSEGRIEFMVPDYARRIDAIVDADGYEPTEVTSLLHGRSGPYDVQTTVSKASSSGETESASTASEVAPSELTELYEAFLSLRRAVDAVVTAAGVEEGPMVEWRVTLTTFLESGLKGWEEGYGPQQQNRSPITASEYRVQFGDGDKVTSFEAAQVSDPEPAIGALCREVGGVESVVLPVSPSSSTPLPIVVENESELTEARELLPEFPANPDVGDQPSSASAETDLTTVSGVTEADAEVLNAAGFETVSDLRDAPYEKIAEISEIPDHLVLRIKADLE